MCSILNIDPKPAARKYGRFSIFFHIFSKIEPSKKYYPRIGVQYYQIKANEMPFPMQKKSFRFDKKVYVGRTLSWIPALDFGEILREFGEILGKHRILDGRSMGSKGCLARRAPKGRVP